MERVTLVMSVYNQLALTRACLDSLRFTTEPFQLVVIDNGSTDETPRFFEHYEYPYPLLFARNLTNQSVIATLNRAWRMAETEFVCILHNDTEFPEAEWLSRLLEPFEDPDTGITGLYGVKRLRRNGRFVGRTVVHSLAEGPTVRPPREEVAVIDSVCMCLPRPLMEDVGGFDEAYGFYHGLDRVRPVRPPRRRHAHAGFPEPARARAGGSRLACGRARPLRRKTRSPAAVRRPFQA